MFNAENVWDYVIAIALAAGGGLADLLHKKDSTKIKVGRILAKLFISGFAGLMTLLLARASGLTGDWLGLVSGMAGWIGPGILDLIGHKVGKTVGIDVKKKEKGDDL